MDVLPQLQVQVQIAIAAPLSLAAARIGDSRFSDAAEPGDHGAPLGFAVEVLLDRAQNLIGVVAGKLVELPREWAGLDEYHIEIVSQCGMKKQTTLSREAKKNYPSQEPHRENYGDETPKFVRQNHVRATHPTR